MIAVLCAVLFVLSVCAAVFFDCSWIFCLIAAAVSAVLFIIEVFLFRQSKIKHVLAGLAAVAGLCLCLFIPVRPTAYGLLDHTAMYEKYLDAAYGSKKDKADKALAELTEKYGEDDNTRFIRVCSLVASGDVGEAETVAAAFSNKASPFYLMAQEDIISKKYASAEEIAAQMLPLYLEAADNNPDWDYPAKHAGGLLFDAGEYDRACYYLTRALLYSEDEDPELYFLLGAALCEQDQYEKGLPLLNRAYELGVDDETVGLIAYYVEQSGMGEQ
ncbi:MAG: hypothetical protein IJ825_07215 [Oscillospiraceae bacterium]|nr:hypothetical protein [Oscillospiraceae bacterium]